MSDLEWGAIESLVDEIIEMQANRLLECGRSVVPNLTHEDLLQPNDYSLLENSPIFRYEEGVLIGMKTLQAAMRALKKDYEKP